MSRQQLKEKGFTIIEVVLVLAIAALIFLMVFIALPALQRNQRDTARKTVLGKVSSAVTTYQSNKRGAQPTHGIDLNGYIDGVAATASDKALNHDMAATEEDSKIDKDYIVRVNTYGTGGVADGTIGDADTNFVQVVTGARCNEDGTVKTGSSRNAAIIIVMENGLVTDNLKASATCQEV